MPRISLHKIADAISNHTMREVRRCGGDTLWFDYQQLIELIQKYGKQRERDGMKKSVRARMTR